MERGVPLENLKRFQAKWKPVRVKKTRQIRNPEPRFDSIETGLWYRSGANVGHPVRFERFNSLADFSRGLAKEVGCALMRFVMVQGISRSRCC